MNQNNLPLNGTSKSRNLKYLVFGMLFLWISFLNGFVLAQEGHNNRPSFLQPDENLERTINGSVFATSVLKEKYPGKKFPVPNRIYFTDKNDNVLKVFNYFPDGSKKQSANLYTYGSRKYIAVSRFYDLNGTEISNCAILNLSGTVLFTKKNDGTLFISDSLNRFVFVDPMDGQLQIFDDHGNLLKEEKYSDFTEVPQDDEEVDQLQMDAGKVSDDGNVFCFPRYKPDSKNVFYELTLLDFDGRILLQKKISNWYGQILKVFDENKIITIFERTFTPGVFRYVGYDFDGNLLWVTNSPGYVFKEVSEDGTFMKSSKGTKLDLKTGEIISE